MFRIDAPEDFAQILNYKHFHYQRYLIKILRHENEG